MSRPRSLDKRQAIFDATLKLIAECGLSGIRTSAISKTASIAEGTLFTYFKTKEDLVRALYVDLKHEMVDVLVSRLPHHASTREQIRYLWNAYIDWGIRWPEKRRAIEQLQIATEITPELRAQASAPLADIEHLIKDGIEHGLLREYPVNYMGAALVALAETTMNFMLDDADQALRYREMGFEMLWQGIATS
ncbi:TetR/AcrR family transcriptional regulator [Herbaspirillum frisingense]|uniref:TetR/AcrR family transcriptional regulator n=1 Tax=Herbaspirillum frisingense TaxID=92645 RepID=UPI0015FEDB0A|nr:TetR/AcrR family transcriptional regulator [Herbaspirillum frisingense]QNB05862.1 TetR/AcrR family transcriptional regulator [Herbaspirillum frisingense]